MQFISVLLEFHSCKSDHFTIVCAMVSTFSTLQNKNFTLSQLVLLYVDVPMPVLAP